MCGGGTIRARHFHTLAANFLPKRVLRKKKLDLTVTHPLRAQGPSQQSSAHGPQASRARVVQPACCAELQI